MNPLPTPIAEALQALAATTQSPLAVTAQKLCAQANRADTLSAAEYADFLLQSERLAKIQAAGKACDVELIAKLDAVEPKQWSDFPELPCALSKQKRLTHSMLRSIKLDPLPAETATLRINPSYLARHPVEEAIDYCRRHGIGIDLDTDDIDFDNVLIPLLNDDELQSLSDLRSKRLRQCSHNLRYGAELTDAQVAVRQRHEEKFTRYETDSTRDYYRRAGSGDLTYNLAYIPTPEEAVLDGMEYADYLEFYFESCDQPWDAIATAQRKLIGRFNQAKELRITDEDGTDIRMSLQGHTFANSAIQRNTPGSEIFSGPVKESVNGVIVAKGNFVMSKPFPARCKDITLKFVNGRVIEGFAAEGNDDLQKVLSYDDTRDPSDPKFEGSRHVGEIGIGTNPHIRQHLANGLLVEKIGGSFHVALGTCYSNQYMGKPTYMANGNKSDIHWDLTTMLRGRGGKMYLDGHLIQDHGEWIANGPLRIKDKDVAVLNHGWAALPDYQQPKHWREKLAAIQEKGR